MEQGINVFLSHNHQDKPFVRKLANLLQSQGLNVWLDERKIRAGESITGKISEGLEINDIFIVVLSQNSINAPWVNEELKVALNKRIKKQCKIIPIVLGDCEIPTFLIDYLYLDFRKEDVFIENMENLLDSILFSDDNLSKYREVFPGKGLVLRSFLGVDVQGDNQERSYFSEKVELLSIRMIPEFTKLLIIDGNLEEIDATGGNILVTQESKSNVKVEHTWIPAVDVGKTINFTYQYLSVDEFKFANSWTYKIESPTRKFSYKFKFSSENIPFEFSVIVTRSRAPVENIIITPKFVDNHAIYEGEIDYPIYQDKYEFTWIKS